MRSFFLLFILLHSISINAQSFAITSLWDQANSGQNVLSVTQDSIGYIWVGTENGLWCSDGSSWSKIDFADKQARALSAITIFQDRIYAGSTTGEIFELKNKILQPFESWEGHPSVAISDFKTDNEGRLWMATQGEGVYYFFNSRWYLINEDNGLASNTVNCLALLDDGRICAGTDRGINSIKIKEKIPSIANIEIKEPNPLITALKSDNNILLAGTFDGNIYRINTADQSNTSSPAYLTAKSPITSFALSPNQVYAGTNGDGLLFFDKDSDQAAKKNKQNFKNEQTLTTAINDIQRISKLQQLKEGRLLVSGNGPGILMMQTQLTPLLSSTESPTQTQSILKTNNDQVWFGQLDGLYITATSGGSKSRFEHPDFPSKAVVVCMHQDADDNIWLGTFDYGVFKYKPESKKITHFNSKNGLKDLNVISICETSEGIFLGTLGGVFEIDKKSYTISNSHLEGIIIYSLLADNKERVWAGTDAEGVHCLSDKAQIYLQNKTIYSICQDGNSRYWFNTRRNGLFHLKEEQLETFELADFPELLSLTTDINSNLIGLHREGVIRINKESLIYSPFAFASAGKSPIPMTNAISRSEGMIWFGTEEGPYRLDCTNSKFEQNPVINLEYTLAGGKIIKDGARIEAASANMEFFFRAPWHGNLVPIYEYMLQGLDTNWISTKNFRVNYMNLSPGKYNFQVRAKMPYQIQIEDQANISFKIMRPLFLQPGFIILGIAFLLFIFWYWVRSREQNLKIKQQYEKDNILAQFETLRSQVNPHFLFNSFNTLSGLIEESPGRAQQYVERLSGLFRHVLEIRNEDLITVERELEILQDYLEVQKARYEENLIFDCDLREDTLQYFIPPMSLQHLVENAIKHNIVSARKPLYIKIFAKCSEDKPKEKKLLVENNVQARRTSVKGTGLGLENLSRRLTLLGLGSIEINKDEAHFTVSVPLALKPTKK